MHLSACIREHKPVGFPMVRLRVFDRLIGGSKTWGAKNLVLEFVSLMCVHYTPERVFWLEDVIFEKFLWFEYKYVITIFCNLQIIGFSLLKYNIFIPVPCMVSSVQFSSVQFSSVQSLSRVRLFAIPWIAAHQAFLSITNSRSSPKLTSIESVMPYSHLIPCRPLLLLPPIPPSISLFQWVNSSHEVAKILEFQL